jgi:uncharacterized protein (TIGR02118 family)
MIKLTVLYGFPADPEAFEEYYADVHLPLVEKMPGADRWEAARVMETMEGIPTYHRIEEFWFESYDRLEAALGSPEGQALVGSISEFASGGTTTLLSEVSDSRVGGEEDSEEGPNATEAAKRKADELAVDLSQVKGSGSKGRITVKDVTSAANQS